MFLFLPRCCPWQGFSGSFVLSFGVFLVEGFLGWAEKSRGPSRKELGTGLEGV